MAEFFHGVRVAEAATEVQAKPSLPTSLTLFIGTAPIGPVNEPVRLKSRAQAAAMFGFSTDYRSYTLHEVIEGHFGINQASDAIFVNVMDPTKHNKEHTATINLLKNRTKTAILYPLLGSVSLLQGGTELVRGTDFVPSIDTDGFLIIDVPNGSSITLPANGLTIACSLPDIDTVQPADVKGSVDPTTGKRTGLAILDIIMAAIGVAPTIICAPKFSTQTEIVDAMTAAAKKIDTVYKAIVLFDYNTTALRTAADVIAQKTITDESAYGAYPKALRAGRQYHLSTLVAGVIGQMDADNGGAPTASPSNRTINIDKLVLQDGTNIFMDYMTANALNANGITTVLRMSSSFRLWGNRTSAYPSSPDIKDNMLASKRTMYWINNTLIANTISRVDGQVSPRFIEQIISETNIWLNGLTSAGAILGGSCTFAREDNPDADLLSGIVRFRVNVGLTPIAEDIEFTVKVDTSYLETLFSA